jgi:hypothetical protein
MERSIPIIAVGYNRPEALQRLLNSLLKASYPGKVELIISIDGDKETRGQGDRETGRQGDKETRRQGDKETRRQGEKGKRGKGEEVRRVAREFVWPFGEKRLIFHETNIGLRKHVISCGDLSKDYDGVIVLEDDLYVSPGFYEYTVQAFDYYKDDPKIAGISLYSHAYNEAAQFPFRSLTDDSDVFFLQYAASLGQFWSREGWSAFKYWYSNLSEGQALENLPPNIKLWPETSWKKYFIGYIVQHDLYFAYPRFSLTTHFSDEGTNMRVRESLFQVPLWLDKQVFSFKHFDESNAVYDVYCETIAGRLKRMVPSLKDYDFEVDLYGMKSKGDHKTAMFLSSRKCKNPLKSFGREMKPHEMNILAEIPGDYFSLGKKEDFEEKNYFVRLLKCHEKKELAYWYTIREYHFYKNRLLTTYNSSKYYLHPGFLFRKFIVMANYTYRYFGKK